MFNIFHNKLLCPGFLTKKIRRFLFISNVTFQSFKMSGISFFFARIRVVFCVRNGPSASKSAKRIATGEEPVANY